MRRSLTTYGCLFQDMPAEQVKREMREAGFSLVRVPIFLRQETSKPAIFDYIQDGFKVQVNLNWQPTGRPSSSFPEHMRVVEKRAIEFFQQHEAVKESIPLIVIGNEWDNENYYDNSLYYYIEELRLITSIAQTFEYKTADAGITSTAIQRWMWSQLEGDAQREWELHYFVAPGREDYDDLCRKIEYYISKVKYIPIDYLNIHWYNNVESFGGFKDAAKTYLQRTNKSRLITNEFGIKHDDFSLWEDTVDEVSSYRSGGIEHDVDYAIAYSGINAEGKAIELTDEMLILLED